MSSDKLDRKYQEILPLSELTDIGELEALTKVIEENQSLRSSFTKFSKDDRETLNSFILKTSASYAADGVVFTDTERPDCRVTQQELYYLSFGLHISAGVMSCLFHILNIRSRINFRDEQRKQGKEKDKDIYPNKFEQPMFSKMLLGESLDSFNYENITAELRQSFPKGNVFLLNCWFIPIEHSKQKHWSMVIVDFYKKRIVHLDSQVWNPNIKVRYNRGHIITSLMKFLQYEWNVHNDIEDTLPWDKWQVFPSGESTPYGRHLMQYSDRKYDGGALVLLQADHLALANNSFANITNIDMHDLSSFLFKLVRAIITLGKIDTVNHLFTSYKGEWNNVPDYMDSCSLLKRGKPAFYENLSTCFGYHNKDKWFQSETIEKLRDNDNVLPEKDFESLDTLQKCAYLYDGEKDFPKWNVVELMKEDSLSWKKAKQTARTGTLTWFKDTYDRTYGVSRRNARNQEIFVCNNAERESNHKTANKVLSALEHHIIFDAGCRVISKNEELPKNCFCPFAQNSSKWLRTYEFESLFPGGETCTFNKNVNPTTFINHFKDMDKNCMWHRLVHKYLQNLYAKFWEQRSPECFLSSKSERRQSRAEKETKAYVPTHQHKVIHDNAWDKEQAAKHTKKYAKDVKAYFDEIMANVLADNELTMQFEAGSDDEVNDVIIENTQPAKSSTLVESKELSGGHKVHTSRVARRQQPQPVEDEVQRRPSARNRRFVRNYALSYNQYVRQPSRNAQQQQKVGLPNQKNDAGDVLKMPALPIAAAADSKRPASNVPGYVSVIDVQEDSKMEDLSVASKASSKRTRTVQDVVVPNVMEVKPPPTKKSKQAAQQAKKRDSARILHLVSKTKLLPSVVSALKNRHGEYHICTELLNSDGQKQVTSSRFLYCSYKEGIEYKNKAYEFKAGDIVWTFSYGDPRKGKQFLLSTAQLVDAQNKKEKWEPFVLKPDDIICTNNQPKENSKTKKQSLSYMNVSSFNLDSLCKTPSSCSIKKEFTEETLMASPKCSIYNQSPKEENVDVTSELPLEGKICDGCKRTTFCEKIYATLKAKNCPLPLLEKNGSFLCFSCVAEFNQHHRKLSAMEGLIKCCYNSFQTSIHSWNLEKVVNVNLHNHLDQLINCKRLRKLLKNEMEEEIEVVQVDLRNTFKSMKDYKKSADLINGSFFPHDFNFAKVANCALEVPSDKVGVVRFSHEDDFLMIHPTKIKTKYMVKVSLDECQVIQSLKKGGRAGSAGGIVTPATDSHSLSKCTEKSSTVLMAKQKSCGMGCTYLNANGDVKQYSMVYNDVMMNRVSPNQKKATLLSSRAERSIVVQEMTKRIESFCVANELRLMNKENRLNLENLNRIFENKKISTFVKALKQSGCTSILRSCLLEWACTTGEMRNHQALCAHVDGNKSHPVETLNIFQRLSTTVDVEHKNGTKFNDEIVPGYLIFPIDGICIKMIPGQQIVNCSLKNTIHLPDNSRNKDNWTKVYGPC